MSQNQTDGNADSPNPNEASCKQVYRYYRNDFIENQSSYVDPKCDILDKTLNTIESTLKNARKTSDAVSGSQVLLQLAIFEKERIKNVHCEFRSFKASEFMDKIKANFKVKTNPSQDDEDEAEQEDQFDEYVLTKDNIKHFGQLVMPYFKILPRPNFLIGSLDKEVPVVQRRQRKPRENNQDLEEKRTQIKELTKAALETETNKTVGEVERIHHILRKYYKRSKNTPISLFEFTINPKSFSRTIENIFYVSFLVKDSYAKIFLDENNLPVIVPISEEDKEFTNKKSANQRDVTNVQSVISLTKLEWEEIINVFGIDEAMIPDPPEHK